MCLVFTTHLPAQTPDTSRAGNDSSINEVASPPTRSRLDELLAEHRYLNSKGSPVSLAVRPKKRESDDAFFYVLAGLIFFFGILRTAYSKYFSTLFRVFFNSSLRQSQLTDQLLQSKLPSLLFNLLFVFAGGMYAYLLIRRASSTAEVDWLMLTLCIVGFIAVYLTKYLSLKFTGWLTGYQNEADTYIFIVFLINKIIGVCLLPVIVVMAFALPSVVQVIIMISLIFILVMTLLRFFRSYGFLQHRLNVSRFHFFLYIFALEILPLALIFKAVEVFIVKNL